MVQVSFGIHGTVIYCYYYVQKNILKISDNQSVNPYFLCYSLMVFLRRLCVNCGMKIARKTLIVGAENK